MADHLTFKYEGIHSLLAFNLSRHSIPKNTSSSRKKEGSHCLSSPNQKLGFRPCLPQQNLKHEQTASQPEDQSQDASSSSISESSSKLDGASSRADGSKSGRMRKGPYKKYTTDQKRSAIEMINTGKDIKTVSKQYNIPRRNLLRWRKNGCERKEGGGRPSDFIMEEKLFEMIIRKQITSQRQIRELALSMTNFKKFKASKGWYVKFWRRFNEYRIKHGCKFQQENVKVQLQQ